MTWDGKDRRKDNSRDHDMLTRIDANLSNFMRRFDDHVKIDEQNLLELRTEQKNVRWYLAIGIGIISALEFFKDKIFH